MLECKLCDYYKTIGSKTTGHGGTEKCGFTGVLFSNDVEALNMEYPCHNISYEQYLQRNNKSIESISAFRFNNDDWRYPYKHLHAANALDRYLRRAI